VQLVQLWHFLQPVQLVLPWSLGAVVFSVRSAEDGVEGIQPMITIQTSITRYNGIGRQIVRI
jgi:hypothetical protein